MSALLWVVGVVLFLLLVGVAVGASWLATRPYVGIRQPRYRRTGGLS